MKLEACRECGKIYYDMSNNTICQDCLKKLERKLREVTEYLKENSRAGMEDITADCDVREKQVYQWMKEKRLEVAEESSIKIACKRCGTLICTGKLCTKCELQEQGVLQELARAFGKEENGKHRLKR